MGFKYSQILDMLKSFISRTLGEPKEKLLFFPVKSIDKSNKWWDTSTPTLLFN